MGSKSREVFIPPSDLEPEIRRLVGDENLSPGLRSEMARYGAHLKDRGLSLGHRTREVMRTREFLLRWKQPGPPGLEEVTRFLGRLRSDGHKEKTVAHYAGAIKRFYTWRNDGEPPPGLRRLSTSPREKRKIRPFWTWEEVERMLAATDRPQHRALIMCLMESGARAEEFLKLNVGDLVFAPDSGYVKVKLPTGKTGEYTQLWIKSVPYLLTWFKFHPGPRRADRSLEPTAPLWVGATRRRYGQRLTYPGLYHILQDIGTAVEVPAEKRSPHAARRGNATWLLSQGWSREKTNMWQGREKSSKLIDVYAQDFDLSQEMLRTGGLEPAAAQAQTDEFRPVKCQWCGHYNEAQPPPKRCAECGKPLTIEAVKEMEDKTRQATDFAQLVGGAITDLFQSRPEFEAALKEALERRMKAKAGDPKAA